MKLLFTFPDNVRLGLFRSRLETAGIASEVRNEHLSPAMPGAPFDPELWILDYAQFNEASDLLAAWRQAATSGN